MNSIRAAPTGLIVWPDFFSLKKIRPTVLTPLCVLCELERLKEAGESGLALSEV